MPIPRMLSPLLLDFKKALIPKRGVVHFFAILEG
jgi:hypothetical protein